MLFGTLGLALLAACSSESINEEMTALNASAGTYKMADIAANELVGTWKIDTMTTDVGVDLNVDEVFRQDVLKETSCFDDMFFTFGEDGSVNTGQARLYFETQTGAMECNYKEYGATYTVEGDQLMVTFVFNGTTVTESKTISLLTTEEGQFLKVSLEYFETEGYIPENPVTDTGAEDVKLLEMVYKKQ